MYLTPNQINELLGILERQHIIFLAENVGKDILSSEDTRILKKHGIDVEKLPKIGKIEQAYRFGMLADALGSKAAKGLSYAKFAEMLEAGRFFPLTAAEKASLDIVKLQSYKDIKGLGNRISGDLTQTFIEVDKKQREKYTQIIRDEATKAIANRDGVRELSSRLKKKTKDWARDFDRIADYIMHDAFSRGKADLIEKRRGKGALVYMEVLPNACKKCKELYTKNGREPIVFPLKYILNNGSNIGKKQKDWKPVVPPLHPWCRCEMFEKPEGYDYDPDTGMFTKVKENYKSPVGRESKVKIFVNDKEIQ